MKKILLAAILLFVGGFVSNGTSQVTTGTFEGLVYDYVVGPSLPLAQVSVVAINERTGKLYGTITDIDGRFTISGLRDGRYRVSFSYIGYQTVELANMLAMSGQTTRFRIGMKSDCQ